MPFHYQNPLRLTREQALAALGSAEPRTRMEALLSVSLYDRDWRWAQDRCLGHLADPDRDVVATAILSLGHVARQQHKLDLDRVLPLLEPLRADAAFAGLVSAACDDIRTFVPGAEKTA